MNLLPGNSETDVSFGFKMIQTKENRSSAFPGAARMQMVGPMADVIVSFRLLGRKDRAYGIMRSKGTGNARRGGNRTRR